MLFTPHSGKRIRILLANKQDQGQIHGFNIDLPGDRAPPSLLAVKELTWQAARKKLPQHETPDNWRFVVIDF